MAEIVLNAEKREKLGGGTANQLRAKGRVPGVAYGHGEASIPFHVKELDLRPLIYTHETHTISLKMDGTALRCIMREVQFHPVTDRVVHVDLITIHAGEKLKLDVPVRLVGTAPGVKDGGALDFVLHKLHVEVLPDSIPEHIDVDISNLKIAHSIHIGDIAVNANYVFLGDPKAVIVTVAPPKTGDDTAVAADTAITEPEQIKKGKKDEEEG